MSQAGIAQVVQGLPKFHDPNLIVGAEGFSDAGVYRLRDNLLIVQSVDFFPPLVDDPFVYGQIAAANSLSDLYAMGARPITALNIVGFPDKELDLSILAQILSGGAERIQLSGAVLAGGHSVRDAEIKYGLSVTGIVEPSRLRKNSTAVPGDVLVLTKALGTGFITTAAKKEQCPEDVLQAAIASMIQLNAAASDAASKCGAHASTDITGFALGGHACEMALASDVTLVLELDRMPLLPGVIDLAREGFRTRATATNRAFATEYLRIEGSPDPLLLDILFDAQTSGGLLISVAPQAADELIAQAAAGGATASCVVGEVRAREAAALVVK